MTSEDLTLEYYFDPFCGWCYASAQALDAIAEAYPQSLTMRASGLFANTGGATISSMAEHSWRTGQRIAAMTGQAYTSQYRDRVLHNPNGIFDSIYPTRAILALGEIDRSLEPKLLHALQTARYVDGRDTAEAAVVADIAATIGANHGHPINEMTFADKLVNDKQLAMRTQDHMRETVKMMRELTGKGVPQLLVSIGSHRQVIDDGDLYGGPLTVLKAIDAVRQGALRAEPV
jgi:putative protein-disulfide isomerase